ncbi:hypothetical protein DH2020_047411 [Rehmannia glutinosa]|uniref:Retrovirus-related Pol polyprotein from transposon RE1 n=1 Tax=Rehmannia glutinosa TaxID=99300 RepID=A0ABR0U940_REHGL
MASLANSAVLPTFTTITLRLDRTNYSYWKSQVLATVRAHGFDEFLLGTSSAPTRFVHSSSGSTPVANPEFQTWIRRDSYLLSWLLSSISESMLGHVNRCSTSAEVWSVLEKLFHSSSKARVMHLRLMLQTTKKGDLSIEEYVLKMRGLADSLLAAEQVVSDDDLILYILAGLGSEYESVVVNLTNRNDSLTLQEVQFSLQSHEMRLTHLASVSSPGLSPSVNMVNRRFSSENPNQRGGFGFRGRGRGRFNRTKPRLSILGENKSPCAKKCFKRFDVDYVLHRSSRALITPGYSPSPDPSWYIDSGASAHVTSQLANLNVKAPYYGQDRLTVGNGSRLPISHTRTKHIEIDIHFIREKVQNKVVDVRFIPSEDQLADLLTKPLPLARFQLLCSKLALGSPPGSA